MKSNRADVCDTLPGIPDSARDAVPIVLQRRSMMLDILEVVRTYMAEYMLAYADFCIPLAHSGSSI